MMGDELLPRRSPDKNQRPVVINGIYHVKYSVRNSLVKLELIQQFTFAALNIKGLSLFIISRIYHV